MHTSASVSPVSGGRGRNGSAPEPASSSCHSDIAGYPPVGWLNMIPSFTPAGSQPRPGGQFRSAGGGGTPGGGPGAGPGGPQPRSSGTTPAQTGRSRSAASSSGNPSDTLTDHSVSGSASTAVAASSFADGGRAPSSPGSNASTSTARPCSFAGPCRAAKEPNSIAQRYCIDDSNWLRATTTPSSRVTVAQVGAPSARIRIARDAVDPCTSSRSPSRAQPSGTTTG